MALYLWHSPMKRFVKCFFELLTQILVKVRKCKVQRVCVWRFQLAGFGRLLLLDEVIPLTADTPLRPKCCPCCAWRSVPSSRIFRLRLRPLQCPRWQALSRLQAGQVSASRLVRSWWRCSRPRRIAARRRLCRIRLSMKNLFRVKAKATGLPSGAGKICHGR